MVTINPPPPPTPVSLTNEHLPLAPISQRFADNTEDNATPFTLFGSFVFACYT